MKTFYYLPFSESWMLTKMTEQELTDTSNKTTVTLFCYKLKSLWRFCKVLIMELTWAILMKNVCSFVKFTPGSSSCFSILLNILSVIISNDSTSHRFSSNVNSPSTPNHSGSWALFLFPRYWLDIFESHYKPVKIKDGILWAMQYTSHNPIYGKWALLSNKKNFYWVKNTKGSPQKKKSAKFMTSC